MNSSPFFSCFLVLIVAPVVGSWLGVLIRRLPEGRPVALARSACESCGHELQALELVPVASYLLLHGRCRACGAPIGLFHLWIELAAIAVASWAVLEPGDEVPRLLASCVLGWMLLTAAWIDAEHFVLPDVITLPTLLIGLVATWWLDPSAIADHAAASIIGYLAFRGIGIAYRRWRGRDGLGQGDAKLFGGGWRVGGSRGAAADRAGERRLGNSVRHRAPAARSRANQSHGTAVWSEPRARGVACLAVRQMSKAYLRIVTS